MKYEELTLLIIEVFNKVYRILGYGFLEKVYVKAMCFEFENRGIKYINEFPVNVIYEGRIAGEYVADFIIEDKVVVEIKAIRELFSSDERQLLNYLRCTDKEVGLLLNFGEKPQIRRKVYDNELKKKYLD
ncbi:MAG: GxxExxY protein [Nanoarchaeota archaeon]|nr:GxxExxY protein [Nanoarchaeota archaeon]